MSAAQAGILLLSLLWPFLFIKSDCAIKGTPSSPAHYSRVCVFLKLTNPFTSPQRLAYSHPVNTGVPEGV